MQAFQHGEAFEASLTIAAERGGDLTPLVYARLFERLPEMEAEFWRDKSGAIKGEMLARVFEILLDLAGPRAYAQHMIGTEFITHDAYGIPRELFPTFFTVVAETVQHAAGPEWTQPMSLSWSTLLADIDGILAAVPGLDALEHVHDPTDILPDRTGNLVFPSR